MERICYAPIRKFIRCNVSRRPARERDRMIGSLSGRASVAVVSDTHGFLDPRIAEIVEKCDFAVHAGDIGGVAVLDALRPRSGRVVTVRGNNDVPEQWAMTEHDRLIALPWEDTLELPGGGLAVVHGHRVWDYADRHARLRRTYPAARVIVYGHSHLQVCDRDETPWVLNPGAAGRVRTHGGPVCLVLHADHDHWHVEVRRFTPLAVTPERYPAAAAGHG